ncbi:cell division ATP-binding protein FtsE [Neokomagataea anthophila]|uniref:ATP-binding cassette domain-containing protein n=1 Tax=Neokomagataea anthophila TaxID=2826925 RepID=A0ABS5E586_9PROT|nr:ATP-binding cassette domain-containing protein [Neokomagataea anthophila]MBR0559044.1 ATP-binding cassette domain-containing protein [Neokomagataea anthophila]
MIHLHNVTLSRQGTRGFALRDLNLSLPRSSFSWLVGPSGAGKSSLLELLSLNTRPSHGQMSLLETRVDNASRSTLRHLRRRIGFIPQNYRLIPEWSIFDNIALPLRLHKHREADIRREVHAILNWLGLTQHTEAFPPQLSGGEQQRVAIARALIGRPALLIADEPTHALGEDQAHLLLDAMQQLVSLGTTVIVATHSSALMRSYPAQTLVLQDGTLTQREGTL